jgi:hypothetical protein
MHFSPVSRSLVTTLLLVGASLHKYQGELIFTMHEQHGCGRKKP